MFIPLAAVAEPGEPGAADAPALASLALTTPALASPVAASPAPAPPRPSFATLFASAVSSLNLMSPVIGPFAVAPPVADSPGPAPSAARSALAVGGSVSPVSGSGLAVSPVGGSGSPVDESVGDEARLGGGSSPVRRWVRRAATTAVIALIAVEIVLVWPSLTAALSQLRAPRPGWLAGAVVLELAVLAAYGRMQRRLLMSAGVRAPLHKHIALAYAAHALSATLPAGPAFSTSFNYQRMRRFGATPAVASWVIALSAILSSAALAVITGVAAITAHGTPPWWTLAGLAVAVVAITLGVQRVAHRPDSLTALLARVNRLARRPADSGLDRIRDFTGQLRAARLTPRNGTAAVAHALLNWLLDAACLWMCARAVGVALPPTAVLLAFCAAMSVGTLTIVPGGLGVIDSALVLGLTRAGAALPAAIAIGALYRLLSFGLIVGAGWIVWSVTKNPTSR